MKVTVAGRGRVGGGLADLWETAGHAVQRLGREGGDVSGADVVLLAMPGTVLAEALEGLPGIQGKTVIDATNLVGADPPGGAASNAEYVKSQTGGPTAKSFNTNFAAIYDRIASAGSPPGNLWCGDEEARLAVEQLSRDAGYEPIYAGDLTKAGTQEALLQEWFAIAQGGMGPFFYRMAPPDRF